MTDIKVEQICSLSVKLYGSIDIAVEDIFQNYMEADCSAVAMNPEKVILSREKAIIRQILENNEIRYADGIGVVKVLSNKANTKVARIPGCELWEALMAEAGKKHTPVYLVGAEPSVINTTVNKLKKEYSTNIIGYQDGYFDDETTLIQNIKASGAKIVTVALGTPRQELFIDECRRAGINAFFMGVGGTYDVYTGNVKRAPEIFCKFGLEWFYRLMSQPTRLYRQRNLLKFLFLALQNKL